MKMIVYSTGGVPEEVEGQDVGFEVHGKKFIVHKTPEFGWFITAKPEHKWTVTETSTGFGVCKGATKKEVIKLARKKLKKVSAKKMKAACAKAKKTLSDVLKAREGW